MEDEILILLAQACENEAIKTNLDLELKDSNIMDSLAFIDFLNAIDDIFSVEIQPTAYTSSDWETPRKIVALVCAEVNAAKPTT